MKQFKVVGVICLLATLAGTSFAAVMRVPISLKGTATSDIGAVPITEADLVSAVSNQLVMAVDLASQEVEIEEWQPGLTNQVDRVPGGGTQVLLGSVRMAVVPAATATSATMKFDLESDDVDWDNDGERDTEAGLAVDAKATLSNGQITKLSAKVTSVLNDAAGDHQDHPSTNVVKSIQGKSLWQGNTTFKGSLKSNGTFPAAP